MGRVGKKQKKNPCKQKGFEKKYMHQTCLKCEKTYFLKKHTYTADNLEKNANIKNLPHPSHHFSNGPSLIVSVLGHPKGVGGLTSNFFRGGGMDVFWNDPMIKKIKLELPDNV
jgi:hypothetical protein